MTISSIAYNACARLAQGNVPDNELKKLAVEFIRGEDDLAVYEGVGSGRQLSAWEAAKVFSTDIFCEILESGSANISTYGEPGTTLRKQRETLGFSVAELSRESGVPATVIEDKYLAEIVVHLEYPCLCLCLRGQ